MAYLFILRMDRGAAGWNAGQTLREERDADSLEEEWYSWMRKFSERTPSKRTDRLPAVSGVAKRVASVLDAPYRAGHWYSKDNFWRNICWSVKYPPSEFETLIEDLTKPERYIAPSWSWASRTQVVHWTVFPSQVRQYKSKIIDCQVELAGLDSTGAVE